ncbi:MAG: flavin prenyltransferase UbiX [Hyphococcus sp.]|nr:MAG: flavin prenyltransferase UbiX [Marinicaulis sp.]
MKKIIIGIGGASGVTYGVRLLEKLRDVEDVETHLIMSPIGQMNLGLETDLKLTDVLDLADVTYKFSDLAAAVASGSFKTDGMVVAACSMKTLSGIVHSYADNLLIRAADVCLKDRRPLVLMPRETPLHTGHCKLLYEASSLGAIIAPPMPAMYTRPQTIDDIVDHSVGRVLDLLGIDCDFIKRWNGPKGG